MVTRESTQVQPEDFKRAFAHLPTAVCIVTTGPASDPGGVTVGTLSPLSLAPPLLMFTLMQDSSVLQRLQPGMVIGIQLLSESQAEIATRFSRRGDDRFAGLKLSHAEGAPRLEGAAAWMTALVRDRTTFGDHALVTALVASAEVGAGRPLLHWRRAFTGLAQDAGHRV
ncbi:4-nitrophenol 4-monooxygenase/4-nitrocatechol 2-monooxygenase, reductase component [compost metagenome]